VERRFIESRLRTAAARSGGRMRVEVDRYRSVIRGREEPVEVVNISATIRGSLRSLLPRLRPL